MPRLRRKNVPSKGDVGIGLVTQNPGDKVALRGVRLLCRVVGMTARTQVEQTFVNLEERAIEAVYTFPLPDGAAVCGFEVVFFDKVFTGVVEEVDRAIEKYDDAIAEGHGAYLLEQNRPDVFTVRVGNLKPRQAVTIRLNYVQDLEVVDRSVRLAFPTTVAPRYVSGMGTDPLDAMIDGQALNPPHVLAVPYGLSMEVELRVDGVSNVRSPSHEIKVESSGTFVRGRSIRPLKVTLGGGFAEMNRDVVLEMELAKEQEPFAVWATGERGERFVAVTLVPQFEDEDFEGAAPGPAAETVFVLDCSGSMQGQSMAQATAALECCLRSMSAGETFNVCRFGSSYEMLAGRPFEYSQTTLRAALAFIRRGDDLGGTELYAPLQEILSAPPAQGAVRNIVLLTDGQVSNEPAVIELARRHRSRNRIFMFGIGTACSAFLVNGLARATGGAAEFITEGERVEDKVLRTFGRISSPPVTDVEVELANADGEVAPRELPAVFEGDAVRVFARLPGRAPETVTLRCRTAAGPRAWTVAVREAAEVGDVLPVFWGRAMIRSIEDQTGVAASAAGIVPQPQRQRLLELSRRYNLLCSLTSFIAIEHRSLEDRNEGRPATRRVPVMLARGWGGIDDDIALGEVLCDAGALPALARFSIRSSMPKAQTCDATIDKTLDRTVERRARRAGGFFSSLAGKLFGGMMAPSGGDGSAAGGVAHEGGDPLVTLLAHQSADGAFDDSPLVNRLIKSAAADHAALAAAIDGLLRERHVPSASRDKLAHTLAVLIALRLGFADRREAWNRAAKKAARYLAGEMNVPPAQVEQWLAELEGKAKEANGK